MIDSVTGWFEVVQYYDKIAITIANLVGTMWLSIYPRPIEIAYAQVIKYAHNTYGGRT